MICLHASLGVKVLASLGSRSAGRYDTKDATCGWRGDVFVCLFVRDEHDPSPGRHLAPSMDEYCTKYIREEC